MNNLPIDVLQSVLGGGRVVAVDLRRQVELKMQARISPALSGWQVLVRRRRRGGAPFDPPSVGAILQRSVELAGLLNERTLLARPDLHLYLRPPVGHLGTFDFASAPLLVDEARRYTRDQLDESAWLASSIAETARRLRHRRTRRRGTFSRPPGRGGGAGT